MTQKNYTGGCRCGALRYDIAAEPVFMNHCQCLDCQHLSGTGHSSYLTFPNETLVETGEAEIRETIGDSGSIKRHGSCRICGSPVSLTFAAMPTLFAVHAASLDDPARFKPHVITYADRALPWDQLDPALERRPGLPRA